MKFGDIIIAVVALVIAYYIIGILLEITFFIIKTAVILIVAYLVYIFIKKLL